MTDATLQERVALVAGGTGGLADASAAALREAGVQVHTAAAAGSAAEAVGSVLDDAGRLDLLVNVVEDLPADPFDAAVLHDLGPLVERVLTATFERCQHAARSMLGASGGTIVNLLQDVSVGDGVALAATLRGGLVGMTKVLGTEWVRRGVRVVAVTAGIDAKTGAPVSGEQVGALVTYLCSDGASFITGSHVRAGVDSGL